MSEQRTFFGPGSRIEGNLHVEGDATFQGQIKGKIVGTGVVTVGDQAQIRADIAAPAIIVQGAVRGEVHAKDRLELHRSAKVSGALRAPKLRIDEGAVFEGECRMSPPEGGGQGQKPAPTSGGK